MKALFIHIPKTAGTSIAKAPFVVMHGEYQHKPITFFKEAIENSFTFVRSPYTRFASGVLGHLYATPENFNEWIAGEFLENHKKNFKDWEWLHLIPQYKFIYDEEELGVWYVGRFETLLKDWRILCEYLKQPIYPLQHLNKNKHEVDYMSLYNRKSLDIINKVYHDDFYRLGYKKI